MAENSRELWLKRSVILNILLAVSKLAVGFFSGNRVILADGIHSVSDVISSSFILVSIKLSGKKSERFPYGMHKIEDFAALCGGLIILYAAYIILKEAFLPGKSIAGNINTIYLIIFLLAVLFTQSLFVFFEYRASRKLNSPGVNIDLLDWMLDASSTTLALLSIILHRIGIPHSQRAAMIIISVIIIKEAAGNIKNSILALLDASINPEITEKAKKIILSHPAVSNIQTLYIRRAGSIYIADITLQINERNMEKAHEITDKIEEELKKEIPNLQVITLHYEPAKTPYQKTAILLDKNNQIARRMRDVAKIVIISKTPDGRELSYTVDNPYFGEGKGHSIRLLSWLIKENIREVVFNPQKMDMHRIELFEHLGIKVKRNLNTK